MYIPKYNLSVYIKLLTFMFFRADCWHWTTNGVFFPEEEHLSHSQFSIATYASLCNTEACIMGFSFPISACPLVSFLFSSFWEAKYYILCKFITFPSFVKDNIWNSCFKKSYLMTKNKKNY